MQNLDNIGAPITVTPAVLTDGEASQYRSVLRGLGHLFGSRVVAVVSDYVDLKHKEKVADNVNMLKKPAKKYYLIEVDICSLIPLRKADGVIEISINGRPDLSFPLNGDRPRVFSKDVQDIHNAIVQYEETGKLAFFTEVQLATDVTNDLNVRTAESLRNIANDLMNQASAVDAVNAGTLASTKAYFEQISK